MEFSCIEQLRQVFGLQGPWPWVWVGCVNWGPGWNCNRYLLMLAGPGWNCNRYLLMLAGPGWNCNRYLLMLAGPDGLLPVQPPGNSWGHPGNIPTVRWIPEGQEQGHLCVGRCAGRGGAGRGLPQDAPQGDGLNFNLIARQMKIYIYKMVCCSDFCQSGQLFDVTIRLYYVCFILCNVIYFANWFTPAYVDGSCRWQLHHAAFILPVIYDSFILPVIYDSFILPIIYDSYRSACLYVHSFGRHFIHCWRMDVQVMKFRMTTRRYHKCLLFLPLMWSVQMLPFKEFDGKIWWRSISTIILCQWLNKSKLVVQDFLLFYFLAL